MKTVTVKWNGKEYDVEVDEAIMTVRDFKNAIEKQTCVRPERQKLLNLKLKGKAPDDSTKMSAISLRPGTKIMMMGSLEASVEEAQRIPDDLPPVINDLDIEEEEVAIENRSEYLQKVERRVKDYEVKMLNEMRPGKKLLVLDIDYTLFDHRSTAETGAELMRPFLHEFLTSAYKNYDIVIWSATSMKWIEEKMKLLGVSSHPDYKIAFYLDSLAMITIETQKYGVIEVKPLGVVWGKYKHYTQQNTIMFDDLRRNFLMNPQNGLKIRPFRQAHQNRATDRELLRLSFYLEDIASLEDISTLNHSKWEHYRKDGYNVSTD
ncbi:ubiquitin-like domain-containing CTD phosphatase 1 isoform X1 [Penaeus vannamei]|uniref:Ubiquitin-like domain-containing CTD phosphatase 1 n=2 Tax=Penaeus vannamei TaxID=6689 RepID=A0A423SV00_PENVA|nr:ubiquitin-like domain-containing CTD phosphatase 1 [Penaeus vannamei]ROT68035.1 Ubiquitin-like domain-containing CTD phosphatase 1 [Penaeus vannamei]